MPGSSDTQRLVGAQEDDEILGSEGSFVPAFRPQEHQEYNLADERCLLERPEDEVVLVSNEPTSGRLFTYIVFYLLGIGTMTPWNFFVTAEDVSGFYRGYGLGFINGMSGNFPARICIN